MELGGVGRRYLCYVAALWWDGKGEEWRTNQVVTCCACLTRALGAIAVTERQEGVSRYI